MTAAGPQTRGLVKVKTYSYVFVFGVNTYLCCVYNLCTYIHVCMQVWLPTYCGWTKFLHHLKPWANVCLLAFPGKSSCLGFLGGAFCLDDLKTFCQLMGFPY